MINHTMTFKIIIIKVNKSIIHHYLKLNKCMMTSIIFTTLKRLNNDDSKRDTKTVLIYHTSLFEIELSL